MSTKNILILISCLGITSFFLVGFYFTGFFTGLFIGIVGSFGALVLLFFELLILNDSEQDTLSNEEEVKE